MKFRVFAIFPLQLLISPYLSFSCRQIAPLSCAIKCVPPDSNLCPASFFTSVTLIPVKFIDCLTSRLSHVGLFRVIGEHCERVGYWQKGKGEEIYACVFAYKTSQSFLSMHAFNRLPTHGYFLNRFCIFEGRNF